MIDYRQRLKDLLRELFQFDAADLDFGIYRIMNQRRAEIDDFIEHGLLDIVAQELGLLQAGVVKQKQGELENLRNQIRDSFGADAFDAEGNVITAYRQLPLSLRFIEKQEEVQRAAVSLEVEAEIFNALYTFFSRYYDDGDFISQRRYSREPKYAIPYNGEEVFLHWANRDQYYVKTADMLTDYAFRIQAHGGYRVAFKLAEANTEQNNVKGEKRYFLPAPEKLADFDADTCQLTLYFVYRPLEAAEAEEFGKTRVQEKIIQARLAILLAAVPEATLRGLLSNVPPGKEVMLLELHLRRWTRKSTSDFFIHKDLQGFLERELDFYLKNEIMRLDDVDHANEAQVEDYLTRLKVIRRIGRKIIAFLAQIEDFQKKLFEKPKFIQRAEWCVTLDRIPEALYPEIAANPAQWAQWEALGMPIPPQAQRMPDFLRSRPSLMVDTALYAADFKDVLLAALSEWEGGLEAQRDGLLVHGENFQALQLLQPAYPGKVKCIYIDPPYNTGNDGFVYKDTFQHSSWLAMMEDRLRFAWNLLADDGVIFCSIDEKESSRLRELLYKIFGYNKLGEVIWKNATDNNPTRIALEHEYIFVFAKNIALMPPEWKSPFSEAKEILLSHYEQLKAQGLSTKQIWREYQSFIRDNFEIIGELVRYKFVDDEGPYTGSESVHNPHPGGYDYEIIHPVTGRPMKKPINGYRFPEQTMKREFIDKDRLIYGPDEDRIVKIKLYLRDYLDIFRSVIYLDGRLGAYTLNNLFGKGKIPFENPKPVQLLERILSFSTNSDTIVMDFFVGSGTTGQAVIELNRKFSTQKKYLLVEQGGYFNTVLKPRLAKMVYASEWKDGKPVEGAPGVSHAFEYLALESYEDTLDNLDLDQTAAPQPGLFPPQRDDYLLRYFLDHETRRAQLDLPLFNAPFQATMRARRDGVEQRLPLDLPETANFLLGLNVTRQRAFQHQGRTYRAIWGQRGRQSVVVIWRDAAGLDLQAEAEFVQREILGAQPPDRLYINGDSHLAEAQPIQQVFIQAMRDPKSLGGN